VPRRCSGSCAPALACSVHERMLHHGIDMPPACRSRRARSTRSGEMSGRPQEAPRHELHPFPARQQLPGDPATGRAGVSSRIRSAINEKGRGRQGQFFSCHPLDIGPGLSDLSCCASHSFRVITPIGQGIACALARRTVTSSKITPKVDFDE
jgi:hypothetical protein